MGFLRDFIKFLQNSDIKYIENKCNGITPSKVGYYDENFNETETGRTIVVELKFNYDLISYSTTYSLGTYLNENGERKHLAISWEEDNEKVIKEFNSRKEKLEKIMKECE